MKTISILCTSMLLTFAAAACAQQAESKPAKPESLHDRASYAIGHNLGGNFKRQDVPINVDYLIQGIKDGLAGADPMLTNEEIQATMKDFQQEVMAKQQEEQNLAGAKNKAAAEEFLAANKSRPGVVTTDSGLQYEVITEGTGPKPSASDRVTVNYKGTLLDGTQFDSSYDRGEPATFPVGGVIPGWIEALPLMPVGSKWKLFIPPDLAYGPRGAGGVIGPNSALIFEVELLKIEEPETSEAPPAAETPQQQ